MGVAVTVVGAGCTHDVVSATPPEIVASAITSRSENVLAASAIVGVRNADSVAVRFGLAGSPLDVATPAVIPTDDAAVVPVLGLMPASGYDALVIAYGGGTSTMSDTLRFSTGTLPDDLPAYTAGGIDPSPGFVAFAAGRYGLVIDNTGRVVWYHRFPKSPGLNFQPQPTGRYVALPPPATAGDAPQWIELDPLGRVTRTLGCARGLTPRFHDLLGRTDGSYWIMCDETRTIDLSAFGGTADAQVTGTVVQHVGADGALLFEWSPFDHLHVADLPPEQLGAPGVNWTHGNAIDVDEDGDLYVSFRNLSEIVKIDGRSGSVLWRLGGSHSDLTLENAVAPAFARQHGLRLTDEGELLLLDNLGDPTGSRARRFVIDESVLKVRLMASYGSVPPVVALLGGTTQPLPGGRTLVAFGNGGRVEEYDASGRVVWRIEGEPGYIFRAQRISSLYAPGAGARR